MKLSNAGIIKENKSLKCNNIAALLYEQLRVKQWTKNFLVFSAFIFSFKKATLEMFQNIVIGFFLFCFVSSCVYILNDFFDREADSKHPKKKNRPMASGALNPHFALVFATILLIALLTVALYINTLFAAVLLIYFILNVFYSISLKHVVIIDIMIISSGFVLRAIGGGIIINVQLTPWFLICIMLLALFLAVNKRRSEIILLQNNKEFHRKVLEKYSPELINQLNSIVTTATIMCYALFTFTSGHTIHLMWTIPLVIYGIFRYLYLIHIENKGGSPEKILLEDKHILFTVLFFTLLVIIILKYLE